MKKGRRFDFDHRDYRTSIKGYQPADYAKKKKSRDVEIKSGWHLFHAHASLARDVRG